MELPNASIKSTTVIVGEEEQPITAGEHETEENSVVSGYLFSFPGSETSQMVMNRILSQSQLSNNNSQIHSTGTTPGPITATNTENVERWLKDTIAPDAQISDAVSLAGVAAAVAAIATATVASLRSGKDENMAETDTAVVSAATLVAAKCVVAAEVLGADRDLLASVISTAVKVRSTQDIMALTATLKVKEERNIASVIPVHEEIFPRSGSNVKSLRHWLAKDALEEQAMKEMQNIASGDCSNDSSTSGHNGKLLKKTRNGKHHLKTVSVYINKLDQAILEMESKRRIGTTKKNKYVVVEMVANMPAWPERGGKDFRYFGLNTLGRRGDVKFECKSEEEYERWTRAVSELLAIAAKRKTERENEEVSFKR